MNNTDHQTEIPSAKRIIKLCLIGVCIFGGTLGAIPIFGWLTSPESGSQPTTTVKPKSQEQLASRAYIECQHRIKRQLKSPSSADFPLFTDGAWYNEDTKIYTIKSYVDAKNSFGSEIRNYWSCKVENDNHQWTVISALFESK